MNQNDLQTENLNNQAVIPSVSSGVNVIPDNQNINIVTPVVPEINSTGNVVQPVTTDANSNTNQIITPVVPEVNSTIVQPVMTDISAGNADTSQVVTPVMPVVDGISPSLNQDLTETVVQPVSASSASLDFDLPSSGSSSSINQSISDSNIGNEAIIQPTIDSNNNIVNPSNLNSTQDTVTSISDSDGVSVVSIGQYMGHMLLFSIPIIGFVMLIVKAFDKKNTSISNFAKAILIFSLIGVVIMAISYIIVFVIFGNTLTNVFSGN